MPPVLSAQGPGHPVDTADASGQPRFAKGFSEKHMKAAVHACLAALLAWLLCAPVQAEGARVILVLDGSGSMWGKAGERTKIEIAKDVVGRIVADWKPEDELGLVVYGHRQKGSCDDIEVMREPGQLDAAAYMRSVKSITPKGKTPMTAAVKMAAEALKFTERNATVILVSDGIETCDLDPCAVAEELEKLGVGLVVHTVGFGLDNPEAKGQLQCMAEKTGGISVTAENADELEAALKKTVEATEPAPPPEPAKPAENLTGHVRMAEGAELPDPFRSAAWEIARALEGGGKGDWVATEYGVDIKRQLEPGNYIVKVAVDSASVEVPFAVTADNVIDLQPSLEAGIIKLSGKLDEATPLSGDSVAWEIRRGADWVATKYGPKASFLLGAGDYSVKVSLGSAAAEQAFRIDAGKSQDVVVLLGAGKAEVSAVFDVRGTKVERDLAVEARKGEAELSGEHTWIATQYNPVSTFDLPAGKYLVTGKVGYATGEQPGEVKAGQMTQILINLNAGYLAATAPGASSIEIQSGDKDISGQRKYIGLEYTESLNAALNAGRYHLIAKGKDGALIGEKDVEVKAGERTEVSLP
jgi:Ca-activated chloride channel family protein